MARLMKCIVSANNKGGVGKTTAAVLIAEGLATFHGQRVACVDLDPQANMTTCLMGEDLRAKQIKNNRTIDQYFLGAINANHASLKDFVVPLDGHISFGRIKSPGSVHAAAARTMMIDTERVIIRKCADLEREVSSVRDDMLKRLKSDLAALQNEYDVVIFDTPPTMNIFTEIALLASDYVVLPVVPEDLSTIGFREFVGRISKNHLLSSAAKQNLIILLSRYQKKWLSHGKTVDKVKGYSADLARTYGVKFRLLEAEILAHEAFAQAPEFRGKSPTFDNKYGKAKANAKAVTKAVWSAIA
jgi:cellulose biosynthesis protein BcsQ